MLLFNSLMLALPVVFLIVSVIIAVKAFEKGEYLGKGCKLINSEEFTGMTVEEAKEAVYKGSLAEEFFNKALKFLE